MADFLLVHGSCHGAWCWRDVVPALETLGHGVKTLDLPGVPSGDDPVNGITLDSYANAILDALHGPSVVVGHSMAGFPISAAAEKDPVLIDRLIYVCAYAPRDGMSLVDMRREAPYQPLLSAIEKARDGLGFVFRDDHLQSSLYHDCPDGTVAFARSRLGVQAIAPQATPIRLGDRYGATEKRFVLCTEDRVIPPVYQDRMTADWPQDTVVRLKSGHSPFFSRPLDLARILHALAR